MGSQAPNIHCPYLARQTTKNEYVERFNRTVRYEWLSQHFWQNVDEVQGFVTQWMYKYNHQGPNMALGGITPKQRLAMVA
jgi:putative transposase